MTGQSSDHGLAVPPHSAGSPPAGWYPDPVRGAGWRWWNGTAWTTFVDGATVAAGAEAARKPRRPRWLSVPVAICAPLVALGVILLAVFDPVSALAGLVPLAIVLPVVSWLDRVEPEPRASRAHALMWGASVAIIGALIVNTLVALVAGDVAAMVISAPLVEEALKGLGVVWAVRRREVDGVSDGIVYAAWVAIGFAVVEDMTYFATASVEGAFLPVFVIRAILTPFAHPLFTFWTGLAIGQAVRRGRPIFPAALWGYGLAVLTHMMWNGSLAFGEITPDVDEDVAIGVVLGAAALFVVLFVAVAVTLSSMRRREQRRFVAGVPGMVLRHGIAPDEAAMFASWRGLLQARRRLPRSRRRHFDAVHATIARLVLLHERMPLDPDAERVLAAQLHDARRRLRGEER
jgi:RsiW-degrading membrane proteinase PrsW (M82 family)